MLKRLGRVVWWVGAISFVSSLILCAVALRGGNLGNDVSGDRAQLKALRPKIDAIENSVVPPIQVSSDSFVNSLNSAARIADIPSAMNKAPEAVQKEYAALREQDKRLTTDIQSESDSNRAAPYRLALAGLLAVLALLLWAVAYVLGGRFWLPPRDRS
ncbi:hypothetical protein GALL_231780 [mine drainage metagenome]|uniref:Uncharacterized protein n=1 Tax=mine drainage metagenome TaxID=410659 RepID=A0A1J5RS65_9ZZZZ